jgi:DNA-damage-inducible protein J
MSAVLQKSNMTAEVRTRLSPELKEEATSILADCGLNLSDAYRLFLKQVVRHRGLPFDVKVPNAETIAAMKEVIALSNNPGKDVYEVINELEKNSKRKAR